MSRDALLALEAKSKPVLESALDGLALHSLSEMDRTVLSLMDEASTKAKADPASSVHYDRITGKLAERRTAIENAGKTIANKPSTDLVAEKAKVAELEKNVKEANDKVAAITKERDAAVKLGEALTTEFASKIAEMSESEDAGVGEALAEAMEYAAELKVQVDDLSAKNEASANIILNLTSGKNTLTVQQAVEAALAKYPTLSESKSLFESCTTVQKVNEVAETLAKLTKLKTESDPTRPAPGQRVVSEGEQSPAATAPSTQKPVSEATVTSRAIRLGQGMRLTEGAQLIR